MQNVRLETAPPIESAPSANLKFDVINTGAANLAAILLAGRPWRTDDDEWFHASALLAAILLTAFVFDRLTAVGGGSSSDVVRANSKLWKGCQAGSLFCTQFWPEMKYAVSCSGLQSPLSC